MSEVVQVEYSIVIIVLGFHGTTVTSLFLESTSRLEREPFVVRLRICAWSIATLLITYTRRKGYASVNQKIVGTLQFCLMEKTNNHSYISELVEKCLIGNIRYHIFFFFFFNNTVREIMVITAPVIINNRLIVTNAF